MAATSLAEDSVIEKELEKKLGEFRKRLSKQEDATFKFTTLNQLRAAVRDTQEKQASKGEAMNLTRIQRFLEAFNQFGSIIEVFLNSSEFVAFVWGPMKFLLQVASNFAHAFDTLLDAYEQIGEALPLLEQYAELFKDNKFMINALVEIYGDILEFHARALRVFTWPTWRQIFRSIWKDFDARFKHTLSNLRRHKELVESQAGLAHYQRYHQDRQVFLKQLEQLAEDERRQKFARLLQWISGANSTGDHEDQCQVRQDIPHTGKWLLKHPRYVEWRQDDVPRSSTLWLHGIPGAGKTVLASVVIDDCPAEPTSRTCYFYCKHGDRARTTLLSVLRGLLSQLLRADDPLLCWVDEKYQSSGQHILETRDLSREVLRTLLLNGGKTFLVLDGLDECEVEERKLILQCLTNLIKRCDNQTTGKLRVLVISQDYPDIRKGLSDASEIALKSSDNENDLRDYARVKCEELRERFCLAEDEFDYILTTTCERADGMFLFVKLVMTNLLGQSTREQLGEAISPANFPRGLEEAYARIVERVQRSPHATTAKCILGWITGSKRPLNWREVQCALSIDLSDETVDYDTKRSRVHIRDMCGALINNLSDDRLELVHHTAVHYLELCGLVSGKDSNRDLAQLTLSYFTLPCFDVDLTDDARYKHSCDGHYALLDYAATHWSDHVSETANGLSLEADMETFKPVGSALIDFAAVHSLGHESGCDTSQQDFSRFEKLQNLPFYQDLCQVLLHIRIRQAKGREAQDEVSPLSVAKALEASRSILEDLATDKYVGQDIKDTLSSYYGPRWFKCPKATCYYFHEGFATLKARELHVARHDKPFRCTDATCVTGYKLGFTKQKDRDKHMNIHHPMSGKFAVTFARLRKAKPKPQKPPPSSKKSKTEGSHVCPECGKGLSRSNILKQHLLSHKGEKPFACGKCAKSFLRANDRNRHEKTHLVEKKYPCKGTLRYGVPGSTWGCGKVFQKASALEVHFRSIKGRDCLKAFREEEENIAQWELQAQERKAAGYQLAPIEELLLLNKPTRTPGDEVYPIIADLVLEQDLGENDQGDVDDDLDADTTSNSQATPQNDLSRTETLADEDDPQNFRLAPIRFDARSESTESQS